MDDLIHCVIFKYVVYMYTTYYMFLFSDEGIEYLCTWNLPKRNEKISVAKIEYNTAKLDVLIIPVNECLFGEDITGDGKR